MKKLIEVIEAPKLEWKQNYFPPDKKSESSEAKAMHSIKLKD